MYDILQLNDMLVPELLDIAEQLNIPDVKKTDKQGLIYKILDTQALSAGEKSTVGEKPRRKRIIKATTGNTTEVAEVMNDNQPEPELEKQEVELAKEDKTKKRGRKAKEKEPEQKQEDAVVEYSEEKKATPLKIDPVEID